MSNFKPLIKINDEVIQYKTWRFPSGELGLELEQDYDFRGDMHWYAEIVTSEDLFILELIRTIIPTDVKSVQSLRLPYLPHGRQDRNTTPRAPFSLDIITDRLQRLYFDQIILTTPHSNVSELSITHPVSVIVLDVEEWVAEQLCDFSGNEITNQTLFVAPDAGAEKRVYAMAKHCGVPNVMTCFKKRDPATGEIKGLYVPDDFEYFGKHVVVIDDICDGGATFIHLAEALKKKGIVSEANDKSLSLFVTHGIFSNGARDKLKAAGYDRVEARYTFIEQRLAALSVANEERLKNNG